MRTIGPQTVRYLDTAKREPGSYLGSWLQHNVSEDIRGFEAQYGYFKYEALRPFAGLRRIVSGNRHKGG